MQIEQLPLLLKQWLEELPQEDHELFLTLLSRYTYISSYTSAQRYQKIVKLLEAEIVPLGYALNEVLFVTFDSSTGKKTGGDNVRVDLHRRNIGCIEKSQIIANIGKVSKDDEVLCSSKVILFIDDILGTGHTMKRGMEQFFKAFPNTTSKKLYYSASVPTAAGKKYIDEYCALSGIFIKELFQDEWFARRAFEDGFIFCDEERLEMERRAELYEARLNGFLAPQESYKKSFVFGYGQSGILVSFYYNTPNNTLSSFWKETEWHKPIFVREGTVPKRLSLRQMKVTKKEGQNKAYAMRTAKNDDV